MLNRKYKLIAITTLLVFVSIVPFILPLYRGLVLDILVMMVFASAYNLVFGHLGVVSMGHGLFFGLAGYVTGMLITRWDANVLCFPIGIAIATMFAFLVGWVVFSRIGVGAEKLTKVLFIVVFTLGVTMLAYYLFISPLAHYTGGIRGLHYITSQPIQIIGGVYINLQSALSNYFVVVVVGVICIAVIAKIVSSPLGLIVRGIREGELRVQFLGHNVVRAQIAMFTISGFFAAIAGTLYITRYGLIDVTVFEWVLGCEIIAVCLIGGRKSVYGPVVGATIFYLAKDVLSEYVEAWLLIMGLLVVGIVIFLPEGIVPNVEHMWRKVKWRF